jgi:hypothetical protein
MLEFSSSFTKNGGLDLKAVIAFERASNFWWNDFLTYRIHNYEEWVLNSPPQGFSNKTLYIRPRMKVLTIGIMHETASGALSTTLEIAVDGDHRNTPIDFTEITIGGSTYTHTSTGYADQTHSSGLIQKPFTMFFFTLTNGNHVNDSNPKSVYLH